MNIFLAVTLYDERIYGRCSESILKNCLVLMKTGHTVIPYYNNDLYIDRSRNVCVDVFLASNCSDLVFIDSDLSFDDDAILKLFQYDKAIVAGAYRLKKERLEYSARPDFSRNNNCKEDETGLVYAERVPTGLMRIQRSVFEQMSDHYKMQGDERGIIPFFQTGMIFPNNNGWHGEDVAFCKRWREMGGEIFIEPRINFTHTGVSHFEGNYHEYLLSQSADLLKLDSVKSGISGWMTDGELATLSLLASKSADVVEVGSWKGRSTKALLESCKGMVYAVDTWRGTPGDYSGLAVELRDVYAEFMKNVGHYRNLKVMKGLSVDMANQFYGDRVDTVFIDAGHSYEECSADIEAWLPKCKKIIAGHDYCEQFPGVMQAVNEKFPKVNVVDSIWWAEL